MRLAKGAANPKLELPNPPITARNVVFYVVEGQEAPIGQKTRSLTRTFNREPESDLKPVQRHRALRKPAVIAIVITDMASERQMSARTSDLGVRGCFAVTPTPLNPGTKVRITIGHAGAKVEVFGHVAYVRAEGMGIAFTKVEPDDQEVLDRWMNDLRVH